MLSEAKSENIVAVSGEKTRSPIHVNFSVAWEKRKSAEAGWRHISLLCYRLVKKSGLPQPEPAKSQSS
jgi:hypothetical protein